VRDSLHPPSLLPSHAPVFFSPPKSVHILKP